MKYGAEWSPKGTQADSARWAWDTAQGWSPPGGQRHKATAQAIMPADWDPRTRGQGAHVLTSPPGVAAPSQFLAYTPELDQLHPPGEPAPIQRTNLSLIPGSQPPPQSAAPPMPPSLPDPMSAPLEPDTTMQDEQRALLDALLAATGSLEVAQVGVGADRAQQQAPSIATVQQQILDEATRRFGQDGAQTVAALMRAEGGMSGAVGDLSGEGAHPVGSHGPFQFHPQGQLANYAAALGPRVSLAQAGEQARRDPIGAARWAMDTYLGNAIRSGQAQGLNGEGLFWHVIHTAQNPNARHDARTAGARQAAQHYAQAWRGTPQQTIAQMSGGVDPFDAQGNLRPGFRVVPLSSVAQQGFREAGTPAPPRAEAGSVVDALNPPGSNIEWGRAPAPPPEPTAVQQAIEADTPGLGTPQGLAQAVEARQAAQRAATTPPPSPATVPLIPVSEPEPAGAAPADAAPAAPSGGGLEVPELHKEQVILDAEGNEVGRGYYTLGPGGLRFERSTPTPYQQAQDARENRRIDQAAVRDAEAVRRNQAQEDLRLRQSQQQLVQNQTQLQQARYSYEIDKATGNYIIFDKELGQVIGQMPGITTPLQQQGTTPLFAMMPDPNIPGNRRPEIVVPAYQPPITTTVSAGQRVQRYDPSTQTTETLADYPERPRTVSTGRTLLQENRETGEWDPKYTEPTAGVVASGPGGASSLRNPYTGEQLASLYPAILPGEFGSSSTYDFATKETKPLQGPQRTQVQTGRGGFGIVDPANATYTSVLDDPLHIQPGRRGGITGVNTRTGEATEIRAEEPEEIRSIGDGNVLIPAGRTLNIYYPGMQAPMRFGGGQDRPEWQPRVGAGADRPTADWSPPVPPESVVGTGHKFGEPVSQEGIHKGSDLQAVEGTPALAQVDGVVVDVHYDPQGLGLQVTIRGEDGVERKSGHLLSASVQEGDTVKAGEQIGQVGSTGASTGPHIDVRKIAPDGTYLNPEPELGALAQMPRADQPQVGAGQGPWMPPMMGGFGMPMMPPPMMGGFGAPMGMPPRPPMPGGWAPMPLRPSPPPMLPGGMAPWQPPMAFPPAPAPQQWPPPAPQAPQAPQPPASPLPPMPPLNFGTPFGPAPEIDATRQQIGQQLAAWQPRAGSLTPWIQQQERAPRSEFKPQGLAPWSLPPIQQPTGRSEYTPLPWLGKGQDRPDVGAGQGEWDDAGIGGFNPDTFYSQGVNEWGGFGDYNMYEPNGLGGFGDSNMYAPNDFGGFGDYNMTPPNGTGGLWGNSDFGGMNMSSLFQPPQPPPLQFPDLSQQMQQFRPPQLMPQGQSPQQRPPWSPSGTGSPSNSNAMGGTLSMTPSETERAALARRQQDLTASYYGEQAFQERQKLQMQAQKIQGDLQGLQQGYQNQLAKLEQDWAIHKDDHRFQAEKLHLEQQLANQRDQLTRDLATLQYQNAGADRQLRQREVDNQYQLGMGQLQQQYAIHRDDDAYRRGFASLQNQWQQQSNLLQRDTLGMQNVWKQQENALQRGALGLQDQQAREQNRLQRDVAGLQAAQAGADRQLSLYQSALRNPWLQSLSGMAPAWNAAGGPGEAGRQSARGATAFGRSLPVGGGQDRSEWQPRVGAGQDPGRFPPNFWERVPPYLWDTLPEAAQRAIPLEAWSAAGKRPPWLTSSVDLPEHRVTSQLRDHYLLPGMDNGARDSDRLTAGEHRADLASRSRHDPSIPRPDQPAFEDALRRSINADRVRAVSAANQGYRTRSPSVNAGIPGLPGLVANFPEQFLQFLGDAGQAVGEWFSPPPAYAPGYRDPNPYPGPALPPTTDEWERVGGGQDRPSVGAGQGEWSPSLSGGDSFADMGFAGGSSDWDSLANSFDEFRPFTFNSGNDALNQALQGGGWETGFTPPNPTAYSGGFGLQGPQWEPSSLFAPPEPPQYQDWNTYSAMSPFERAALRTNVEMSGTPWEGWLAGQRQQWGTAGGPTAAPRVNPLEWGNMDGLDHIGFAQMGETFGLGPQDYLAREQRAWSPAQASQVAIRA